MTKRRPFGGSILAQEVHQPLFHHLGFSSSGFWLRISILIRAVWTCNHLTRPPQPSCSKPSSRSRNPPCLCSLSTSPPQPSLPFSAPKTLSRPLSQQGALDLLWYTMASILIPNTLLSHTCLRYTMASMLWAVTSRYMKTFFLCPSLLTVYGLRFRVCDKTLDLRP